MTSSWVGTGIPPVAVERLAEAQRTGTWASALSTQEFVAIRSAGFEPAGQVMGTTVQQLGWTRYGTCGYYSYGLQARTRVSGGSGFGSFGPLVQALYDARRLAVSRMRKECEMLGGDGIVGVKLTVGPFVEAGCLEFQAIGTAVRASGGVRPRRPFTSHLTGQDFAKLISAGWVPVDLVLGISIGIRHDDWTVRASTRRLSSGNVEVDAWTELVNQTRHDSRSMLAKDVAHSGGEGVVVSDVALVIRERECATYEGARDHVAEATAIGTSIAHFKRREGGEQPRSLAIMSLDPERRRAARRPAMSDLVPRTPY